MQNVSDIVVPTNGDRHGKLRNLLLCVGVFVFAMLLYVNTFHHGWVLDDSFLFKDNKFVILIKDNGIGMSQETLARVFEPYYTTKASGTGLGLTMVYKIVKEFSGDIQVESRQGEGSAFIISLPVPQTDKRLLEAK